MSIHIMTQVWKHSKQRGAGLLVLLALADWADDDGYAYPAIEKLARKARVSARTVQRMTDDLVGAKELDIKPGAGPNGVHLYQVTPPVGGDILSPRHPRQRKVTSAPKEGDNGSAQMSPNTSLTIRESLEETSVRETQNAVRKRLELHFRARTALQPPKRKAEAGELWWMPLREIAELAGWEAGNATAVIDECLSRARDRFQVSSPKSILKTARAVIAEQANGQGQSAAEDVKDFNRRIATQREKIRGQLADAQRRTES